MLVAAKQHGLPHLVEILGIGVDHAAKIREFAATYKINYPLLVGDATSLAVLRELGNSGGGLPYTVALSRSAAIVGRKLGALSDAELRQVLASLAG